MKYEDHKVSDIKIAYIGGGSRGWAWRLMADLAMEKALSGTISLYDIDEHAARQNEIIGNRLSNRPDSVGKWVYQTAGSLKECLTGADFVIISILPGTFDEMAVDVHEPEKYGIYQSVGDTAGPGGMMRALRTIPMYVTIANAIKEYSPKAWVINYTNPMSLCVKTLYEVFPEIKAFGCCHEVFGTQKVLKGILEDSLHMDGVTREKIHINVLGINHFTWLSEASYEGIDLFPVYRNYIEENFNKGYIKDEQHWMNSSFTCAHRVKFDLFMRYGLIAAAGDRHLVEFMPGDEYLKDEKTVEAWKFKLTSVDWRKEDLQKRLQKSKRLVAGEEEIELKPSGEEGVLLLKGLLGLERVISNVNIPNTYKQIPNLSERAVVETNAVFSRDHIHPLIAGEIPDDVLALIKPHVENHETILKAALTCDFELAKKAFCNDPLVKAKCGEKEVEELLRDMIRKTAKYLPDGWDYVTKKEDALCFSL
ncbi:MAG: alpha-glucosidase/alpha-galactosidase [Lachnospiraceae bacterium]|nr:alpha-glucosidase/alpha-galactosidase [Lachnospiraceae bacterium]